MSDKRARLAQLRQVYREERLAQERKQAVKDWEEKTAAGKPKEPEPAFAPTKLSKTVVGVLIVLAPPAAGLIAEVISRAAEWLHKVNP